MPAARDRATPWIRVALAERVGALELSVHGAVRMRCCGSRTFAWPAGGALRARRDADAIVIDAGDNGTYRAGGRVVLEPAADSTRTTFGKHRYRGRIEILPAGDSLTVVNEIDLEMYLRGVVPWEIGWHGSVRRAAVEAQAVAARTYAYKRLGQYAESGFDVYAGVADQVYWGTTREDSVANRAIDATRGVVLTRGESLVEAYYSSTCGGHTSRIDAVWPKPPQPYLRGRRDAPDHGGRSYCAASRHFRWTEAWSGADFERTLLETLPPELGLNDAIGALLDVRVTERDESGRAHVLEIETSAGVYRVQGDRIRWVVRPLDRPLLRSTLFELEVERRDGVIVRVVARGGGNGHGVGMCQMGALEMARRGFARDRILEHYYPGTQALDVY